MIDAPDLPRLLLCADPLMPRMADSAFEVETAAIDELGWAYGLLDLEALIDGDAERSTRRLPEGEDRYLYRGWMIPAGRYEELASATAARGLSLVTSPASYVATHHLPNWYATVEPSTPRTVWIEGTPPFVFASIHAALPPFGHGPVIVKDFVKSRKHEWDEACFIPAADDASAVERVVSRFVERQGDDLAGGLVFREFVELEPVGRHSRSGLMLGREYRLFFVDGRLLIGGRYWDDIDYDDNFPAEPFERIAAEISSPFFSMDIAKTAAGDWIVMEIGDGQVSGLPDALPAAEFYRRLMSRFG
jgi:ATP-grasp domain, R2K clade family 3